jgi:hypothetical protein
MVEASSEFCAENLKPMTRQVCNCRGTRPVSAIDPDRMGDPRTAFRPASYDIFWVNFEFSKKSAGFSRGSQPGGDDDDIALGIQGSAARQTF